jgi:hypothetical protein
MLAFVGRNGPATVPARLRGNGDTMRGAISEKQPSPKKTGVPNLRTDCRTRENAHAAGLT